MDIAAMNERILIQKSTVVTDRIGNRTNGWSDFYSCFATISDSTGKSNAEESVAGLVVDTSDINFTVRFCNQAMAVNTTGYRIIWRGETYNIQKIDHLNMKKHALKFRCEKARR